MLVFHLIIVSFYSLFYTLIYNACSKHCVSVALHCIFVYYFIQSQYQTMITIQEIFSYTKSNVFINKSTPCESVLWKGETVACNSEY